MLCVYVSAGIWGGFSPGWTLGPVVRTPVGLAEGEDGDAVEGLVLDAVDGGCASWRGALPPHADSVATATISNKGLRDTFARGASGVTTNRSLGSATCCPTSSRR